jgi:hypothetical protein
MRDAIHIADAAAPVVVRLALAEIHNAIDALSLLGSLVEKPVGSLRHAHNILTEHFARLQRGPSTAQERNAD